MKIIVVILITSITKTIRLTITKFNNKLKIKLKDKNGFLVAQTSVRKHNNNKQSNKQKN